MGWMFLIRWWHPSQLDSDAALRNLKGNETQATLPQSETDVTAGKTCGKPGQAGYSHRPTPWPAALTQPIAHPQSHHRHVWRQPKTDQGPPFPEESLGPFASTTTTPSRCPTSLPTLEYLHRDPWGWSETKKKMSCKKRHTCVKQGKQGPGQGVVFWKAEGSCISGWIIQLRMSRPQQDTPGPGSICMSSGLWYEGIENTGLESDSTRFRCQC